jgi:phage tail sheath gpL-like
MALTNIGSQKTPGRPVEITFDAETGLPADVMTVLCIGHAASGATGVNTVITISNVADPVAGAAEVNAKFGSGSELAKMLIAAINANAIDANANFPPLVAVPLASTDISIAASAQAAIQKVHADFVVSPYDLDADATNRTILSNMAATMSGPGRTDNQQFGTFGVGASNKADPTTLFKMDTQYLTGVWQRDTSGSPGYSLAETAAAYAAILAGNTVPFNPVNDVVVGGQPASTVVADWPSVGAGLDSESCLNRGWTPLRTFPNGNVGIVRSVTGRLSTDGSGTTPVTAYYDVQDFQVLYFWRKTVWTRETQPDFKRAKASVNAAQHLLGEIVRLARQFEDQGMFQSVSQLAKQFLVQRNASDRSRFDVFTPVNVIPGLQVIANNVQAGTQFDSFTI